MDRVLALDPQPDCVVITGDLAEHGAAAEYAILRDILEEFPLPLHLAIGNHDDRAAFVTAFAGSRHVNLSQGPSYAVDYLDATLVVLDSKDEHSAEGAGRLGPEQLNWLDEQLTRRPEAPHLLCLHHPPVQVGITALDSIRLADAAALRDVLSRHRPPALILAGHVHRAITARFADTVVSIAPSTHRQVELNLRSDRPTGYVAEPTGMLLHLLTSTGCVTHALPVSHTSAAFATI